MIKILLYKRIVNIYSYILTFNSYSIPMPIYHYAIMDYESWHIKLGTIQAQSYGDAQLHLESISTSSDIHIMVSENKIPIYKNKTLLHANNDDHE